MASVCIELISVCVEMTLDVYQNRLPFVSKRLYWNKRTLEIRLRLHCTYMYDAMHCGMNTTWRTDDVKERYSFIYNCSAIKEITLTSWELEQGKTFSKQILIGKTEDVHGEWFFGSVISELTVTTRYRKRLLLWNPRACDSQLCTAVSYNLIWGLHTVSTD